jgi:hypothetical protein
MATLIHSRTQYPLGHLTVTTGSRCQNTPKSFFFSHNRHPAGIGTRLPLQDLRVFFVNRFPTLLDPRLGDADLARFHVEAVDAVFVRTQIVQLSSVHVAEGPLL